MYIGIDLGTSSLKVLLLNTQHEVVATTQQPLSVHYPQLYHVEQNPADWWQALQAALDQLSKEHPLQQVRAIGLSGQMHGVVILDKADSVLRPAILWNDGRSMAECVLLEQRLPQVAAITANLIMPGFSAPKLLWLAAHEPDNFAALRMVLLPKDYLRLMLSGEKVSEMSDASGTAFLDVAARKWSHDIVSACGLQLTQLPQLVEGSAPSAQLLPVLAQRWGMRDDVIIAGGAGDNAAAAIGMGVIQPSQAFISLGTSGVVFAPQAQAVPAREKTIHVFCHALPRSWHQMSVMLSCAASVEWAVRMLQFANVEDFMAAACSLSPQQQECAPFFLPYLNGERTPLNDPTASAAWLGLRASHGVADLAYAVLEGVSFGLKDGFVGLNNPADIRLLLAVGGGSRSADWLQLLANVLARPINQAQDSQHAAALGAARLAWLADKPTAVISEICYSNIARQFYPVASTVALLAERYHTFKQWQRLSAVLKS